MGFTQFLFKIRFISEDKWRDTPQKTRCTYCGHNKMCVPYGAWAHQSPDTCDVICQSCGSNPNGPELTPKLKKQVKDLLANYSKVNKGVTKNG